MLSLCVSINSYGNQLEDDLAVNSEETQKLGYFPLGKRK